MRTASAIAQRFGLSRQAVSTEARRLLVSGIIRQDVVGRNKVLAVVDDHPAINALRTLVDLTVGPLVDLKRLYDVDGVERVMVFGSWARRHLGEPGPTPRDIDVLVIGTPDEYVVTSVCLDLSGQYGIEVSPMIVDSDEFASRGRNPILDQITSGPLVEVRQ
ncbi:MAG: ArsR family transcriptional regulator [Ilumatobacteraceae bacterium]|nr:ArsR family transcriptional regulator [Ilumatobacteraceae bacterium]